METFERARLKLEVDRLPKLLIRTSVLRLAAGHQIKDVVCAPQKTRMYLLIGNPSIRIGRSHLKHREPPKLKLLQRQNWPSDTAHLGEATSEGIQRALFGLSNVPASSLCRSKGVQECRHADRKCQKILHSPTGSGLKRLTR